MDVNVKFLLWHSCHTDDSEVKERLSAQYGLDGHICCLEEQTSMLQLAGLFLPICAIGWSSVDHPVIILIVFEVVGGLSDRYQCNIPVQQGRFRHRLEKMDWKKFVDSLAVL